MNTLKKIVLFFAFMLFQNSIIAQTNSVSSSNSSNQNIPIEQNNVLVAPQSATNTAEAIPTPEQQGFDKIIINDKPVYLKKVDNVIIEYKPE